MSDKDKKPGKGDLYMGSQTITDDQGRKVTTHFVQTIRSSDDHSEAEAVAVDTSSESAVNTQSISKGPGGAD